MPTMIAVGVPRIRKSGSPMSAPMNPPTFSRPSTISQLYVRMRKLVQNGMTSSRMRRPLRFPARVARK